MSERPERPEMPEEDGIPLDDQGIRNDEIIEVLDTLIRDTWNDVCHNKKKLTIEERKEVAMTLQIVWDLARDIMDIDDRLRMISDYFEQNEDFDEDDLPDEPD